MKKLLIALFLSTLFFAPLSYSYEEQQFVYMTTELDDTISFQKTDAKSQAAARAKARYGGKVLSVKRISSEGKPTFRVKLLLDNGKVKVVKI